MFFYSSFFSRSVKGIPHFKLFKNHTPEDAAMRAALRKNVRLSGVFANPKWFAGCVGDVKHKLRIKDSYIKMARRIIRDLIIQSKRQNVTTVGVHVRRGDKSKQEWRLPHMAYFSKAMFFFKHKYKNVLFIVSSDDRLYVMEKFVQLTEYQADIVHVPKNNYTIDFAILSQCDFVIQSEGTFSQWAAIFNGKESTYCIEHQRGTLWPHWIPVRD